METSLDVEHFHSFRPAGHYGVPGCVRIALEGLWGYWLTYRKISEISYKSVDQKSSLFLIARSHRRHADRLREPDPTTLWYLQIGPEVERIR